MYITFIVQFDEEYTKTKYITNGPNYINQSKAPATEEIVVEKLRTDKSILSRSTEETSLGLTGETRASVTP